MEDEELKQIWNEYDRKLEEARLLNLQSWALNFQWFRNVQTGKARSGMRGLIRFKLIAVLLGLVWLGFLGLLIYGNQLRNLYFTVSIGIIFLFNLLAVIVYIRQILLILRIDYSEPVTVVQERIAVLELSTLWSTRVLWLQMPFYATWFWDRRWIDFHSWPFWLIQVPITVFLLIIAIRLYRNINIRNIGKPWVRRLMMAGPEYKTLVQAKQFMGEIEEFKKEIALGTLIRDDRL